MRLHMVCLLVPLLWGCGNLRRSFGEDEFSSSLQTNGGDASVGPNATNTQVLPVLDGGTVVPDAGSPPVDLSRPLKFTALTNLPSGESFVGVHGFSSNALWFISSYNIYFFDGSKFIAPKQQPTTLMGSLRAIWATSAQEVFVVANSGVWVWRSNCQTTAANYESFSAPLAPGESGVVFSDEDNLTGICATANAKVYVVGFDMNFKKSRLYRWDGSGLELLFSRQDVTHFESCALDEKGEIVIAAREFLVRYDPQTDNVFVERPDYSSLLMSPQLVQWNDVLQVGSKMFAAGSNHLLATRQGDGKWQVRNGEENFDRPFRALSGSHPSEVFAWGDADGARSVAKFDGLEWAFAQGLPSNIHVKAAWSPSANLHVIVGDSNVTTSRGLVFVGTR